MPPRGSPPLQSGGQNQRWTTSGQGGYITRAAWGVPTASEWGAEAEVAHKWARWSHNPCHLGGPHCFTWGGGGAESEVAHKRAAYGVPTASGRGAEYEVAHKWARWVHNPCRLGGPHHFRSGGGISGGPQVGKVAT